MEMLVPARRPPWSLARSDDIGNVEDLAALASKDLDNGLSLTANPLVRQRTLPLARLTAAVIVTRRRVVNRSCGARARLLSDRGFPPYDDCIVPSWARGNGPWASCSPRLPSWSRSAWGLPHRAHAVLEDDALPKFGSAHRNRRIETSLVFTMALNEMETLKVLCVNMVGYAKVKLESEKLSG